MNRNNLIKSFFVSFILLFLLVVTPLTVQAVWSGSTYTPGTTLDPECTPSQTSCNVTAPVTVSTVVGSGLVETANGVEIEDNGVALTKLSDSSCTNGQIIKFNGTNWYCGVDNTGTFGSGTTSQYLRGDQTWQTLDKSTVGLGNVENTAVSTWTGSGNITTLGTITGGIWNGSDISLGTRTSGNYVQSVLGGTGITGGSSGSEGANLTLSLDINGLTAETTVSDNDYIPMYDTSVSAIRKVSKSDLLMGITGSLLYQGAWDAASTSTPETCNVTNSNHYWVATSVGNSYLSGDWTICNGTSWQRLANSNAVTRVFGRSGIVTAADGDYTSSQINNVASGNIGSNTVQSALNELDTEKLSTVLISGQLFIGNTSNIATAVSLSGDASLSNTGALTINNDAIALGTKTSGNYVKSITNGSGISGGNSGGEGSDLTLALDIDGLTALTSADNNDYVPIYDTSALTNKKITKNDLLAGITGSLLYQGTWDASSTATPETCNSTNNNHYWIVSTAGNGYVAGDWAICNGTSWEQVSSTVAVNSVFGRTGGVTAQSGDYAASMISSTAYGNIGAVDVQSAINELDDEKLTKNLTSGQIFVGNGSNVATGLVLTGDASISNAGVLSIGTGKITNGMILGSVDWAKIDKTGSKLSDFDAPAYSGNADKVLAVNSAGNGLTWVTPSSGGTSTLSDGAIFVGNSSNIATGVVMSGDATLNNSGVLSIGASKVVNSMLATITVANKVYGSALQLGTNSGLMDASGLVIDLDGSSLTLGVNGLAINLTSTNSWSGIQTFASPILNGSLSGTAIDTDGMLTANSDTVLASQKAVKTYVGNFVSGLAWRPATDLIDTTQTDVNTNVVGQSTYTTDSVSLTNGMRILFTNETTNPGTYNNRVFVVGGVGSAITLTLAIDGQAGTGAPTAADTLFIKSGTANTGRTYTYVGGSWVQAGSLSGSLLAVNNFSDLGDVAAARTNLGLGTTNSPTFGGLTLSTGTSNTAIATFASTAGDVQFFTTGATPEASVTGSIGDVAIDATNGSMYLKTSGNGTDTGWTIFATGGCSTSGCTFTGTGTNSLTVSGTDGALAISSNGAGAVSIDSGTTGNIDIGTGSNSKMITMGNSTSATGLAFNSGTSGMNFDNGTFFVNSVTNRVGIGTTNTVSTLTLKANSTITSLGQLNIGTSSNGSLTVMSDGSGDVYFDSGTTGSVHIGDGSYDKQIFIGNSTLTTGVEVYSGLDGIRLASTADSLDALSLNANAVTTANGMLLNVNALTTGNGLKVSGDMTGAGNLVQITEDVASTGTGYMLNVGTTVGSTAKPLLVQARGQDVINTTATGDLIFGDVDKTTNITFNTLASGTTPSVFAPNVAAAATAYTSGSIMGDYDTSSTSVGPSNGTRVGTDGFPVMSYFDTTNQDLKFAKCNNINCSSVTTRTIDNTASHIMGQYSSITIGTDGFPIISYIDATDNDLMMAHCNDASCSTSTTRELDTVAGAESTDIEIGTDGFAVIAYHDATNGDLQLYHCSNTACSAGTTAAVDTTTGDTVGTMASVIIGGNGFPFIVYKDETNSVMKVAHCTDATCSTPVRTVLSAANPVGSRIGLALTSDNLPIISWATSAGAINVWRCSVASCANNGSSVSVATGMSTTSMTTIITASDGLPMIVASQASENAFTLIKCVDVGCNNVVNNTIISGNSMSWPSIIKGSDGLPFLTYFDGTQGDASFIKCINNYCRQGNTNTYITYGVDLGTQSSFFRNIYTANVFSKTAQVSYFDVAEEYPTADSSLSAGEIVAIDTSNSTYVKRASQGDSLLGVVSTQPGLLLGDWSDDSSVKRIPLALAGRVPVLVIGDIKAGDSLTLSESAGVARKAQAGEQTIGKALANSENGQVMMFVSMGAETAQIASTPALVEVATMQTDALTALDMRTKNIVAVEDGKTVFKGIVMADTIQANHIIGLDYATGTGLNEVDDKLVKTGVTLNDLTAQLASMSAKLTDSSLSLNLNGLEAQGAVTFKSGAEFQGNAIFKALAEFIDNVIFQKDVEFAGRATFNNDSAGYAKILKGQSTVEVKFDKEYATKPIVNVTVGGIYRGMQYAVIDVSTKGFTVQIDPTQDKDVEFNWSAIAVKDAKTQESVISTPTPTPAQSDAPTSNPSLEPTTTPSATPTETPSTDTLTPNVEPTVSPTATVSPEITPEATPTITN